MKKISYIIVIFFFPVSILFAQDTLFYEDFSGGSIPSEWTQEFITGPSDVEWKVDEGVGETGGVPDTAAIGEFNLLYHKWDTGDTTQLKLSPINLEFAIKPELTFWHAQVYMDPAFEDYHEQLQVYYKEGKDGELVKMAHYSESTHEDEWVFRMISPDLLDTKSDSTYLIFEGITGSGLGLCVDAITITETGIIPRYLTDINTIQASTERIAAGTENNPMLRTELRVYGNTEDFVLDEFTVNSLNTDDNDIEDNGVKLFLTNSRSFNTSNQISPGGVNFVDGEAKFENLGAVLPTGYSYIWVTYDIKEYAGNVNEANAYIPEDGILANDTLYPPVDHNPDGHRIIYGTVFYDDFEDPEDWNLIGEFEIDEPLGLGGEVAGQVGSDGLPGANYAYTGSNILGTNITTHEGNYEAGLEDSDYQAITPNIDTYYYKNINLNYRRWLNIYFSGVNDKAAIDISTDNGATWEEVWRSGAAHMNTSAWSYQSIDIPEIDRKDNVLIRYTLGPTQDYHRYSGWNIDDVSLTGNYITRDVGVIDWLYPNDRCGHTSEEEVAIEVKNFGAEPTPLEIPVGFSLDGGDNWQMDTIYLTDPIDPKNSITYVFEPKADFSQPGRYNDIIASTFLEADQDDSNDEYYTTVFAVPTYELAYSEDFISDDGLWTAYGDNISWKWAQPGGSVIENAHTGQHAWVTNEDTHYNSDEVSWVESPCFDYTGDDYSVMEFWLNIDTEEDMDGVSLQYSLDEGIVWTTLEPHDVEVEEFVWNWYTNENIASLETEYGNGKGWDGQSEGWMHPRIVMPSGTFDDQIVKFRFVFASDQNIGEHEGVAFDMLQLYKAPHDVGVEALLDPHSDCELPEDQEITITVKNYGINSIETGTSIPVGIDVNELSPVYEDFELTEPLDPEETVNYTFETTFDLSEVGDHNITAYTMLPGDTDFYEPGVFNDTLSTNITVYGYPTVYLGEDVYTTEPDTVTLDAGEGFETYLWQDGFDEREYEVTQPFTYEYNVTAIDFNGCPDSDTVRVVAHDIAVAEALAPISDCELGENEQVTVRLENVGPDNISSGTEVPLSFYHIETYITTDEIILTEDLTPGSSITHTFDQEFDLTEEIIHEFRVYHNYKDADPVNDTLDFGIEVYGYPTVDLGEDIYTTEPDTVALDAGEGFETYLWQDGFDEREYEVSLPFTYEYNVTAIDFNGCPDSDTVKLHVYDIAVAGVLAPISDCELGENEQVTVQIQNVGPDDIDGGTEIPLSFYHEGMHITTDEIILTEDLISGGSITHTFDREFDLTEETIHEFRVYHHYKDADPVNDTLDFGIEVYGYPTVDLGEDIYTTEPDTVVLDAGEGLESYLWQDGWDDRFYSDVSIYSDYYNVTATDIYGCTAFDMLEVVTFDIELDDLLATEESHVCGLSDEEPVTISLINHGPESFDDGDEFVFVFNLNSSFILQDTLTLSDQWNSDESKEFTFSTTVNMEDIQEYAFEIYMKTLDANAENDTIKSSVEVIGYPQPVLPSFIATNQLDTLELDAGDGFETYSWSTSATSQTIDITEYGNYSVTVTNWLDCVGEASTEVIPENYDLMMGNIIEPAGICVDDESVIPEVEVVNVGNMIFSEGTEIEIGYMFNDNDEVFEYKELENDFLPGDYFIYTFNEHIDEIAQNDWSFKTWIFADDDTDNTNDTVLIDDIVRPLPDIDLGEDIYTMEHDTVILDAGEDYDDYLWQDGSYQHYFNVYNYGMQWVRVTDEFGCQNRDTIFIIEGTGETGVNSLLIDNHSIYVYPNPVDEYIYVAFDLKNRHKVQFYVSSMSGNVISRHEFYSQGYSEYKINTDDYEPGVYFINIEIEERSKVLKFIKR